MYIKNQKLKRLKNAKKNHFKLKKSNQIKNLTKAKLI